MTFVFFFNDTATTEIYTLSLHDALPISRRLGLAQVHPQRGWEALRRIGWSIQAPRPRHAREAAPAEQATFKGGSKGRARRAKRHILAVPSRAGPRDGPASARSRSRRGARAPTAHGPSPPSHL